MPDTTSSTTDVKDASASAPHLICYFRTRNENGDDVGRETTSGKVLLSQETGKKSSYLLQRKEGHHVENADADAKDNIDWYSIPKPAHLIVEHAKYPSTTTESNKDCTFFFGGLQLVFNSKNIEIYMTSPGGKETYLMTCKGIPHKLNEKENVSKESESIRPKVVEWRRALCVVPGGPRCISCLRIKLIGSTSTTDSTIIKVRYMKLTARIMNHSPSSTRTPTLKLPIPTTNPQEVGRNLPSFNPSMFASATTTTDSTSNSEPPLTQKDLGAAMAGLSFMARKTEENMAELFKQQSKKVEGHLESYFTRMEMQMRALKPTLAVQHQIIKENQIIMKEQQQMMDYQTTQINKLLSDNQDLQVRVQSLQADMSILRSQTSYTDIGEANECLDRNDDDMSEPKDTTNSPSSNPLSVDANDSPSAALGTQENNIKMENAHLRNAIQNISRGINEEPLLEGCGGINTTYPGTIKYTTMNMGNSPSASLGSQKNNMKMENAHLRNVIQNIARGIDEEPLLEGCGGNNTMYPGTIKYTAMNMENKSLKGAELGAEMKTNKNHFKEAASITAKEIEEMPIDGVCGSLLHGIEGGIMRKIDSVISSRIKPAAIPLVTTGSMKNIQNEYNEELYNHASNIEVTLMQDEQIETEEEENDKEKGFVDGKMIDETRLMVLSDEKSREDK
jgi:hypothetical protein